MKEINAPEADEFAPFYGGYVAQIGSANVLEVLQKQIGEINDLAFQIGEENKDFSYAEGKWTIAELFGHLIDTERVFVYRAMRFARGDVKPLAGFDQNLYVTNGESANYRLKDLAAEFVHLRNANLLFFQNLTEQQINRRGEASGFEFSVRALVFIAAGHVAHHLKVLRERYLNAI